MASNQSKQTYYREWQYPRIASFLPLALFIPAVWIVGAPFNTDIGLVIGAAFAAIGLVLKLSGAKNIIVTADTLELGDASIPRKAIGKIEQIPAADQFFARGAKLDSRAFVFLKYGLPGMLKIEIKDPKDPTPYLLVSTRNAKLLAEALS